MSDLFGNHIVGFPTRRLTYCSMYAVQLLRSKLICTFVFASVGKTLFFHDVSDEAKTSEDNAVFIIGGKNSVSCKTTYI